MRQGRSIGRPFNIVALSQLIFSQIRAFKKEHLLKHTFSVELNHFFKVNKQNNI